VAIQKVTNGFGTYQKGENDIVCTCPNVIKHSIPLKEIFDSLQKQIPATKGPIESIYALIEQKKAMKLNQCMLD